MLGHYVARYDNGEYANVVVNGDVHSITVSAIGAICVIVRDTAKTWIYAWLYGAGDEKLGKILRKGVKAGSLSRKLFLDKIPALGKLVAAVKAKHRAVKHLIGLDKRILHTRSEHAALNTLLQGGGAITCKVWLTVLHRKLRERGWRNGADYMQILWVHDEVQILARPEIADEVGKIAVEAVREAGRQLGLRCPLDGEYKVGQTWAQTH
jgi:DNA polymerase I-like protein with 3'-5' exonuclease and polymerase domains